MLREKGRMTLDRPTTDWFRHVLSDEIARLVAIDVAIAAEAGGLPREAIHGDPADRIVGHEAHGDPATVMAGEDRDPGTRCHRRMDG